MDFFSKDNILILAAEDKKKKGGGMLAILELLKEFAGLTDKIKACADAQDMSENRGKVEEVGKKIEESFNELLGLVKLRSETPVENGIPAEQPPKAEAPTAAPAAPALPATPTPTV
jgi:hypothetical protein